MAKPYGRTVFPTRFPQLPNLEMIPIVESRVNGGMVTTIDPADIENNQQQLCLNARVRFDRTSRRPGTINLGVAKNDSNSVLVIKYLKKKSGLQYTFRFTPSSVAFLNGNNWTPLTGALHGTSKDRISIVNVLDEFCFANNGADNIQKIDLTTNSFAALGDAPKYRYITGFYNRLVGAARIGESEVEVGWSGDANISVWNPDVDETAGSSPIVESPSDLSDFITGIFGSTNTMILLREKSIWLSTKQPIPTNPFNFYTAIPGLGCDSPSSAVLAINGLIWFDSRTGTVWAYSPGSQPEPIGRPIERTIRNSLDDPRRVFGSYSPTPNEYTLAVPVVGNKIVKTYTYNFRTKAWITDEYYDICSINDTDYASASITVDELVGTIDSQTVTIDELAPSNPLTTARLLGRNDGEILQEDANAVNDAPHTDGNDGTYSMQIVSKAFNLPVNDVIVAELRIEYQAKVAGTFEIQYSKTGGTQDDWIVAKTVTPQIVDKPVLLRFRKQVKARRYAWRLVATQGIFDILSYEVHVYRSAESK